MHKLSRCNRSRKAGISPVLSTPPGDFTIHKKKNSAGVSLEGAGDWTQLELTDALVSISVN